MWTCQYTVAAGVNALVAVATYGPGSAGTATVPVNSAPVNVYAAALTVTAAGWEPKNKDGAVWIGNDFYAPVTATLSGGLDSDGSQPTYATYAWGLLAAWESDDGGATIPFATCDLPTPGWAEKGSGIGTGTDIENFDAAFGNPGYYVLKVQCIATVHLSSTGAEIGTAANVAYIGGTAGLVGDVTSHVMRANGLEAHQATGTTPVKYSGPPLVNGNVELKATPDSLLVGHRADGVGLRINLQGLP